MSAKKAKVKWNFYTIMFWVMRISGICLFLIAMVGFVGALLLGGRVQLDLSTLLRWTFFPNPNHVISSVDVQNGWQNGFWDAVQLILVLIGIVHGMSGLRKVLEDYFKGSKVKVGIRAGLMIFGVGLFVIALFVIRAG